MNLKEKLMKLEGLELTRTYKHDLATSQSQFNLTVPLPLINQMVVEKVQGHVQMWELVLWANNQKVQKQE